MNSTSTTTNFQITKNYKQQVIKYQLSPTVFTFAVFLFPFFKAIEYMFCFLIYFLYSNISARGIY